jgi:hypothetical protein
VLGTDTGDAGTTRDHADEVQELVPGNGQAEREHVAAGIPLALGWRQPGDVVGVVELVMV